MLERLRQGTVAGLMAGAAVILVFFVYDLARLEPFATPAFLAQTIFGQPAQSTIDLSAAGQAAEWIRTGMWLGAYALAHLAAFVGVGIAAAWLFQVRGAPANVLTGALYGGVAGSAVFYGGYALSAPDFVSAPDWRLMLFANVVAGVVIVAQLLGDSEGEGET